MTFIPPKYRKFIYFTLFVVIIAFQVVLFYYWKIQNENKETLSKAVEKINKPNLTMIYGNKATNYFFEADNYFSQYLLTYNPEMLRKYKISLQNMAAVIDTLGLIAERNDNIKQIMNSKENLGYEVVTLKKRLDSLINNGFNTIPPPTSPKFDAEKYKLKDYNTSNVIKSITYDTIYQEGAAPEKKGLFSRLGNAIAGKTSVKEDKVQIKVTMKMGKENVSGNFQEQISRLSTDMDSHYKKSFDVTHQQFQNNLRHTYNLLQNKDKEIIKLNEEIVKNSTAMINYFSKVAQEANMFQQQQFIIQFNQEINQQSKIIEDLLIGLGIATILLLLYTIMAQSYEKRLEKAQKMAVKNDNLKTRILGMLSHEMRAPLNIISNNVDIVKQENSNPHIEKNINSILYNSNSLYLTVNQILDYVKNQSTELKVYNINLNLKHEIENIAQSLSLLAKTKNIEIIDNLNYSTDQLVWADQVKIHQLFYNLIGNAIKFTQDGKIKISAILYKDNQYLKLYVEISDTGEGIDSSDLPYIFDNYYQSKKHNENNKLGMGLGLNLCKEIVELYDGHISIESEKGKGTLVKFDMLFDPPQLLSDKENKQEDITINHTGKKVALVDDDEFMRKLLVNLLKNAGFEVYEFDTSQKIINFLTSNKVDLIITDIQLPEISGIELSERIRNLYNENKDTPIIAITGDITVNFSNFKSIKINDYIIKPINKNELYEKITTIFA